MRAEPAVSHPCCGDDVYGDRYYTIGAVLGENPEVKHRKLWEFVYIVDTLTNMGALQPGMHGLGFGVGTEPLVAHFANQGCRITATDLPDTHRDVALWAPSGQHISSLDVLNERGLCNQDMFNQLVTFQPVDMTSFPELPDNTYDFIWSSCAFEHLGGIEPGLRFVQDAMRIVKPGGVAVHTTEYNVSSDNHTIDSGPVVLFRQQDLAELQRRLLADGHKVDMRFDVPDGSPLDQHVDTPPYSADLHLKMWFCGYVTTSYGLCVVKGGGL